MNAQLLIDSTGPEIRHRTGIDAPDEFIYLKTENGAEYVFFDAREFAIQQERLQGNKSSISVKPIEPYFEKALQANSDAPVMQQVLLEILHDFGVRTVTISASLPYGWVQALQADGLSVTTHNFAAERMLKTDEEIDGMQQVQKINDECMQLATQILQDSVIGPDNALQWNEQPLTSEAMRAELQIFLLRHGLTCPDKMVVAGGSRSARPHDMGSGQLYAHESIIVDIFPFDERSGYYADMTRTFCKGEPSNELLELHKTVHAVQEHAISLVKPDITFAEIHQAVIDEFASRGHATSSERGFLHKTGHAIGMGLHEHPYFDLSFQTKMAPGHVVTIEPGLYYPEIGGVRIEDTVAIRSDGSVVNLTSSPKQLIIP